MKETSIQDGLTCGMISSFVSIPFTGPIGIIGLGSCLVVKMYRGMNNERTRKKLIQEKKEIREKKKEEKIKEGMYNFLEKESERRGYISSMQEGSELLNKYLSNLPYEDYSRIKQMDILEKKATILGFPIGGKYLEVRTLK
jgi:hypothetical protein